VPCYGGSPTPILPKDSGGARHAVKVPWAVFANLPNMRGHAGKRASTAAIPLGEMSLGAAQTTLCQRLGT